MIHVARITRNEDNDSIIGKEHRREQQPRSRAPTYHRWRAASPCCRGAPHGSRWRTRHWKLYEGELVSQPHKYWHIWSYIPRSGLTLNNGVNGAALLAVTTVDALGHVDIVTGRPAASVLTLLSLNSDSLRRADGLAELAGDTALLTGGITAQGVLTTETRGNRTLLKGVEDSVAVGGGQNQLMLLVAWVADEVKDLRRAEVLLQHDVHATDHLGEEEVLGGLVNGGLGALIPALRRGQTETGLRGARWGCCAGHRGREVCREPMGVKGERRTATSLATCRVAAIVKEV